MDEYPNAEEEFDLMYEDELELLKDHDNEDEIVNITCSKARKSLNFNTPSKSAPQTSQTESVSDLFESDVPEPSTSKSPFEAEVDIGSDINSINDLSQPSVNRKRTVEDLFGDVDDLFYNEVDEYSNAKKLKLDEKHQKDTELIDLIVQKRTEFRQSHNLASIGVNIDNVFRDEDRYERNISREVPKYPFIRIKDYEKNNVYIRFHSEAYEEEESKRLIDEASFKGTMGDNFEKLWGDAEQLLNTPTISVENTDSGDAEMLDRSNHEKQLWVELYKPRKYLELLSDESTNRTILKWMKLWDKVVFNRNPKIKISEPQPTDNKKKFFKFNELNTNLDEYGRPEKKVVLLCGPPGLGKTTLAHMVARHAGYNVVEINASDDRSTDAFRNALETATQMRSVIDQDRRPNCIVFDEIDGAPQASIDFLVKFISGTATAKNKKGKGKDKTQFILKRPIICICNDAYVPALRPLKQIAFVINFPQTSSVRLAERLVEIARRQQIKTDMGPMTALAEKSHNDIRSCLSVLHFFKVQDKPIGLSDVYKASVGQKDMQKGLFAIWSEIFEIKRVKKATGSTAPTLKERMSEVLSAVSSFGDHERVAQGVFENYPKLNIKDSNMERVAQAMDWFCFNDIFNKQIYTTQNYSLWSYLDYAFVVWHFTFGSFQPQKLTYPSAGFEARAKEIRQKAVIAEVLRGMTAPVRCYNSTIPLTLDTLPLLLRVISPPFRPVSLHLYNEEEKTNLLRVASIMADYNLNYIQERKQDGVYEYNLDPNIEDLVTFGTSNNRRKLPSYSNKQLIAREIEMEKMRRFEAQTAKKTEPAKKKDQSAVAGTSTMLPNHLQTLKLKTVTKEKIAKPAVRRDFFGRFVAVPASSSGKSNQNARKNDIWFKYKEGYSNAVRRKIKISALQ